MAGPQPAGGDLGVGIIGASRARHVVAVLLAVEESGRTGREVVIPEGDYAEPD